MENVEGVESVKKNVESAEKKKRKFFTIFQFLYINLYFLIKYIKNF